MDFSSQTVRENVQVFWSYSANANTGDCFAFTGANPNIVSFPNSATCDISNCFTFNGEFRMVMTGSYTGGTQITISQFLYMEYSNPTGVVLSWEYRAGGCTNAGTPLAFFIDFSDFITIPSSAITIASDSDTVGTNTNGLTVTARGVTFPDSGQVIVTVPKRIGTTSMISSNSCNGFVQTGLTGASCDGIAIKTAADEITVTFTGINGADVVLTFTDFDNPFTTTAWPGFGYEVKQNNGANEFYSVSYGENFSMTKLSNPITLDASLALADGTIESVDTIEIFFDDSTAKVANICDFRVIFPDDFGYNGGSSAVQGRGCFGSSLAPGTYITTTKRYTFTYPDTNTYLGGTFLGEGMCPAQSADLECGIKIRGIINPEFVATTDSLQIQLLDSAGGLIAQQTQGLKILDSQLKPGTVTLNSLTSNNMEVQATGVTFTLTFTPTNTVDAKTSIIIDWPTDLPLSNSCTATSASMDTPAGTCDPTAGTITFSTPFSSDKGAGYQIVVTVDSATNQDAVVDAGTIQIDVYSKDNLNAPKLKDQYAGASGYIATAGQITKNGLVNVDGGVTPTPTTTYALDAVYEFFVECEHSVAAGGFVQITLPSTIGTSGSGTNSNCLFNGNAPALCTVDDSAGTVIIELGVGQTINGLGTPFTISFGGIRNPRTFENSGFIGMKTMDSSSNTIDEGNAQFSVQMDTMGEFTGLEMEILDDTNLVTTNYTIQFSTTIPIQDGDKLYMTFPTEVDLPTTVECDVHPDQIRTDIDEITCTNTGQSLIVEIVTLDTSPATGDFSFILIGVTNPGTTAPSSAFSNIFLTDSSAFNAIQYSTAFTVETSKGAYLDVELTQTSYDIAAMDVTYTFEWTPNSDYPEDAVIILTWPDSISINSKFGCLVYGPRYSGSLCSISTISQRILIERAFIGWNSGYSKSMKIEKKFFNNLDDATASEPGTFTIEVYTEDNLDYIIDARTVNLPPLLDCTWPCKDCLSSNKTYCLDCFYSGLYNFLQGSECKLECDAGWTTNGSDPKVCIACDDSCVDCLDEGNDEDKFRCTQCSSGYNKQYVTDNRCFVECGFGYYDVNDFACGKCESPCADCTENYYTCTACLASTGLPFAYEGGCLENCPDGTGAINNVCYDCASPCSTCVNSTTSCTSCDGRGGKAWLFVDKCYENCPDGTTANTVTNTCTGCLSGCDLCSSKNQTYCLLCTSPLLVLDGECLASCPEGYSKSYDGKSCVDGLLDLPILYFPHFILSGFVLVACALAYFKSSDTLFLSNFIAFNGFVEGVAFFAQMVVSFTLQATNYGAVSFVGLLINIGLNLYWHIHFKKYMKDPSFNLWQSDHKKVTKGVQAVSAIFSFKLTRLHFAKFAGLDYFRAGFTDPNVMWKPLVFFTIAQGVGVYSIFTVQAIVGLRTMRWGSQLYIMIIETLVYSILMTILQIIELFRIRQFLGDIYNPLPGETNATMDPLNPELRSKLLASIVNKVKGQRGNFLNNNLDELLDMFGPRKCQSDRDRDKPEWGEDEREVKSWPVSPKNEKDYQDLLNQPKFKPFGFMENIDQPDNVFTESKPANPKGNAGKDFSDGWGQTKDSEFQSLLDKKKGDLVTEGDSDDEYRKKRAKQKSKRGRQNKYHTEINAEDDNQNDSLAELEEDDLGDDVDAIKEVDEDEDDEIEEKGKGRGRGKKVSIQEDSPLRGAGPSDYKSPEQEAKERKEAEKKAKEEEKQRLAEEKKRQEEEKKRKKEEEKLRLAEEKKRQEEEKQRKKEEEKAKKEAEKKAKEEAKLKAAEEAKAKKEYEKKAKEDEKLRKEEEKKRQAEEKKRLEDEKKKIEEEKLSKQRMQDEGDLTAEKRAQEAMDADNRMFEEEAVGAGDRAMPPPMMTSSTPEGKRSDLKREEKKVTKLSEEPEVQIPPNPLTRNFNESDILGQLERDKKGNVIVPDELKDQKSRKINPKGYLLDKDGNIIDKEKGDVMFNKNEIDEMGEIPAPFCVEKFNFNPFTIKAKGSPKRGRKVNDKGWLTDQNGNIIEDRFGRVKFDKQQLTKDGDLPKMFNYNGKRFDIQDVMGDLDVLPNGDLNFKKDPQTGKNVDKKGRPVNDRGYLVDHEGNVISKNNQKIFDSDHLENGEIPKIFPFTKFNTKNVLGNFEMDPVGVPILGKDRNGNLIDNDGKRVNKQGYLVDDQGNVVDKRTDAVMFNNSVLDRDGDIPKVFRTGLLRSDTNSSLQKIISDIERGNDQSEFDHEERILNSHMRQHATPEGAEGQPGHKRKASGETSEGSVMGITPSDYNFLNQRFEPDLDNVGEVIEEENEEGGRRKRRIKKKPQPQKTYVDPRGVEMATAYGGPIPKPKPRKTVLGQKPMVNDKAKERLSKLANSISGYQGDETHSRRGSNANKTADGFMDHHQREQQLKKRQMDKINKKKLAAQAKKAKAQGMDQPDFEKMFGKDIDQFLEDSDWEIESFERMSNFSRGSARSFSDPKKLRGLESIYLQRLEASQKKHGVSKKNPAKFRAMQDRTVDPAEAFNEEGSQKNFGLPPVNQKAISMQKGSSKNSDQGNLFAGNAKKYGKEGGWMQN